MEDLGKNLTERMQKQTNKQTKAQTLKRIRDEGDSDEPL